MLSPKQQDKLMRFCRALIDQERAKVLIEPNQRADGFWFGGGNLVEGPEGDLYLVGRYRNAGDSRTGLERGARGLELAIFRSTDRGESFTKIVSRRKADLGVGSRNVLSIEGSVLHFTEEGVELFFSTEKDGRSYPVGLEAFHKPGTGIWSIDRLAGDWVEALQEAEPESVLNCDDPRWIHVKDPFLYPREDDTLLMGFATHPYNWSSSNTGYTVREEGGRFGDRDFTFFPRGFAWDVAISRGTAWLRAPQVGVFADGPPCTLLFYDGGECMRNLEEHSQAVSRPRGYSCEELGGVAVASADGVSKIERLSVNLPAFVSAWGRGTSRYIDVLTTSEGYYATWQQSKSDLSQPLVMNFLSQRRVEGILSA